MANQLKLVATITPANTAVEASTDNGVSWQAVAMSTVGSQQEGLLINVAANTYAAGTIKLRSVAFPAVVASEPLARTVVAVSYLHIFIGDSITNQDQFPENGAGGYTVNTGPGYTARLPTRLGTPANVSYLNKGYSGRWAQWFIDNQLASTVTAANSSTPTNISISIAFFGGNGLALAIGNQSAQQEHDAVKSLCQQLRAGITKPVKIAVLGIVNRIDSAADAGFDARRLAFNDLVRQDWPTFADGYGDPSNQPTAFASAATTATQYFPDGVHASGTGGANGLGGVGILTEEVAHVIAPQLGVSLSPAYQLNLDYTALPSAGFPYSLPVTL